MAKCIGSGTFGKVFDTDDVNVVEKKIKLEDYHEYGISDEIIKEIGNLNILKHSPYIVPYLRAEFDMKLSNVSLFFTKYESTLQAITTTPRKDNILKIIFQILLGIKDAQRSKVLHRDLKPSNIFLNSENNVVIGDWGSSYLIWNTNKILSDCIQTLQYRAPEVLLGCRKYGSSIDIWSVGCILYELYYKKFLFEIDDDDKQIFAIFQLLGSPTNISGLTSLPLYEQTWPIFCRHEYNLNEMQKKFDDDELWDLFLKMIELDPQTRFSVDQCLEHKCFNSIRELFPSNQKLILFESINVSLEHHKDVNLKMRIMVFDWIFEICQRLRSELNVFFLAIEYVDLYLIKHLDVARNKLQLISITCLMLADKLLEDSMQRPIADYCYLCDDIFSKQDLLKQEMHILESLQHDLIRFSHVNYLKENIHDDEILRKSCCMLFLLQSQATYVHPQNIVDYYTSQNNDCSSEIKFILAMQHAKSIVTKTVYLFDSKTMYATYRRGDGECSCPHFLQK